MSEPTTEREINKRREDIIKRYNFGDSLAVISKIHNISRQRVHQILKAHAKWNEEK